MLEKSEGEARLNENVAFERASGKVGPFTFMAAQSFKTDRLDQKRI
ncbi:hypothetical protein [Rhodoblastus sp.]